MSASLIKTKHIVFKNNFDGYLKVRNLEARVGKAFQGFLKSWHCRVKPQSRVIPGSVPTLDTRGSSHELTHWCHCPRPEATAISKEESKTVFCLHGACTLIANAVDCYL